jgi:hypothetical protein
VTRAEITTPDDYLISLLVRQRHEDARMTGLARWFTEKSEAGRYGGLTSNDARYSASSLSSSARSDRSALAGPANRTVPFSRT